MESPSKIVSIEDYCPNALIFDLCP